MGLVYGPASGRSFHLISICRVDIQPKTDEFRIRVLSGEVNVSKIIAGDGSTSTDTITVDIATGLAGLDVDTAFNIDGVPDGAYNGSFTVSEVLFQDTVQFNHIIQI